MRWLEKEKELFLLVFQQRYKVKYIYRLYVQL